MGAEGTKQSKENSTTYTQLLGKTHFHIHSLVGPTLLQERLTSLCLCNSVTL